MNLLYSVPPLDVFPSPHVSAFSVQRLCDGLFLEMVQLKCAISNVDKKAKRASTTMEREAFDWLIHQYQQTFAATQSRLSQLQQEIGR